MTNDDNQGLPVRITQRPMELAVVKAQVARAYGVSEDAGEGIAVLLHTILSQYSARMTDMGASVDDEGDSPRIDATGIADMVSRYIGEYVPDGSNFAEEGPARAALYDLAFKVSVALRLHPNVANNLGAQKLVDEGLGIPRDASECISDTFYLGVETGRDRDTSLIGRTNTLVKDYFAAVPLGLSLRELRSVTNPIDLILEDWGAAVNYCRSKGTPEEAFLSDGAALFRFAPNALAYINGHAEQFPGLDPSKVNDGSYVEGWLTSANIGEGEGQVPYQNWMVLLTGYTPEDNAAIPGLELRYSEPLVTAALHIASHRMRPMEQQRD